MNWKISVYRFLERNFSEEILNTMDSNNLAIYLTFKRIDQDVIIKLSDALKRKECCFDIIIFPQEGSKIVLVFSKKEKLTPAP